MTKYEMKKIIYREFMRLVEPDKRDEIKPVDADDEAWETACREVMYEMDHRSSGSRKISRVMR